MQRGEPDLTIDGIGEPTFRESLETTAQFGTLASVGQAGGALASLSVADLTPQRSIAFHAPSVMAYLADRSRDGRISDEVLQSFRFASQTGPQFPLVDAAAAQLALENGLTTGAPLLVI